MKNTKTRMTTSAVALLQERGVNGLTIDAVLAESGAPRGSVYHHFPGGRAELVYAAARISSDFITEFIRAHAESPLEETLADLVDLWRQSLRRSDFRSGCPIAALIHETDPELRPSVELAADTFEVWIDLLKNAFVLNGYPESVAAHQSVLVVAAIEGAITLCRAQRSVEPLDIVAGQLARQITSSP